MIPEIKASPPIFELAIFYFVIIRINYNLYVNSKGTYVVFFYPFVISLVNSMRVVIYSA